MKQQPSKSEIDQFIEDIFKLDYWQFHDDSMIGKMFIYPITARFWNSCWLGSEQTAKIRPKG
jgi:hypothetical protein